MNELKVISNDFDDFLFKELQFRCNLSKPKIHISFGGNQIKQDGLVL